MLTLPPRSGPRPRTTLTNPHQQMDQHGPAEWGDRLVSEVGSWPGVLVAPSAISVPGSRAFWLKPTDALGPESAFMTGTEFAHVHPPYDGSLHLTLPEEIATRIQTLGWGELHPLALQGLLPNNHHHDLCPERCQRVRTRSQHSANLPSLRHWNQRN
jgi:hypothetical protein